MLASFDASYLAALATLAALAAFATADIHFS